MRWCTKMDKCEVCVPDHRNHGQAHVDNVDCVAGRRESMQCIKDTWLKLKMPALLKMLTFLNKEMKKSQLLMILRWQFWSQKSWKMVTESKMVFEISKRFLSRLLNCLNVLLWSGNGKAWNTVVAIPKYLDPQALSLLNECLNHALCSSLFGPERFHALFLV